MKKLKAATLIMSVCLSTAVVAGMAGSTVSQSTNNTVKPMFEMISTKLDSSTQSPSGYSPAQIKKAYGIDKISTTGKGQTIALIVAFDDPNIQSDVATFSNYYNLPQANIKVDNLGSSSQNNDNSDAAGWALETSLDTEWAHAIAPDANLLVVEAASESSDDLMSAVDTAVNSGAQVVSMSWGEYEERSDSSYDSHFTSTNTVFLAAAGDEGAGAEWPSSSPNVIAVGGTTLKLDSTGNRVSETGWRDSGGGVSFIEHEPQWQTTMGIHTMGNKRATPDVAFDANPNTGVSVYCSIPQTDDYGNTESGWFTLGGTSLGTPSWAGLIADLNQNSVVIKNADSLYTLAGTSSYTNQAQAFNDITSGSNGYQARLGYDAVTGLGTPEADKMAGQSSATTVKSIAQKSQQLLKKVLPKIR